MVFLGSFLQWFGLFSLIGCIVIFIMSARLLKKELPTEQERKELLAKGWIKENDKKFVLRQQALKLRYYKEFKQEQKNALLKQTQHK